MNRSTHPSRYSSFLGQGSKARQELLSSSRREETLIEFVLRSVSFLRAAARRLLRVARIFNLSYRRIASCTASADPKTPDKPDAQPIGNRAHSAAWQGRNQKGARLGPQDEPRRTEAAGVLRLVGTTQSRSEPFARLATISSDPDRLQVCAATATAALDRYPVRAAAILCLLSAAPVWAESPKREAELVNVRKIWDAAPHNAFTDLAQFNGEWFCVFREGKAHVSPDGALRVISSRDGEQWTSAALITSSNGDLRDAKITITPDRRLMLSGASALHPPAAVKHQSLAWFSKDGSQWSDPVKIGDPNMWLWRTTWHQKTAYSIGYDTAGERFIRLYSSKDGQNFDPLVPTLFSEGYPNETSLLFQPDQTLLCLLRRDGNPGSGQLGLSKPPYTEWTWKDLGLKIGGPHMLRLPDGRIVAAGRLYDGGARTSLMWLDPDAGKLTEFLKFPSGGDTSYPGLVWHKDLLWVSYYSSHEGKTSIYLAKVKLPAGE